MRYIVGLSGRAGAGKNTVADFMTEFFGYNQVSFAEPLREEVARVTLYRERIPHDIISAAAAGNKDMQELAALLLQARDFEYQVPLRNPAVESGSTPPDLLGLLEPPSSVFQPLATRKARGMDPWFKPTHNVMRRVLQLWGTEFRRAQDTNYWVKQLRLAIERGKPAEAITDSRLWVITDVRFPNEVEVPNLLVWIARPSVDSKEATHVSESIITPDMAHLRIYNTGDRASLGQQVLSLLRDAPARYLPRDNAKLRMVS